MNGADRGVLANLTKPDEPGGRASGVSALGSYSVGLVSGAGEAGVAVGSGLGHSSMHAASLFTRHAFFSHLKTSAAPLR